MEAEVAAASAEATTIIFIKDWMKLKLMKLVIEFSLFLQGAVIAQLGER